MASSRDDMVFTPSLGPQHRASAVTRAREERRMAGAKRKGGIFRRMLKLRAAQRLVRARRLRSSRRALNMARAGRAGVAARGASTAVGAARGVVTRSAILNPVGIAVAATVIAIAVATRLLSGRSFENMGQVVNDMLLGDLDDNARADIAAKKRIMGDGDLMRMYSRGGQASAQFGRLFADLKTVAMRDEVGRSFFEGRKEFQSNNIFDILILRARDKLVQAWKDAGGSEALERLRLVYHSLFGGADIIRRMLR